MKERGPANVPAIVLSVLGIITAGFLISFVYMSANGKDYSPVYSERIDSGEITNPLSFFALVVQEDTGSYPTITIDTGEGEKKIIIKSENLHNYTLQDIQRQLVNYASVVLKIYNLHNIPFTSITPKVQVYIDDNFYYMEILRGDIILNDGVALNPDIIIRMTSASILNGLEQENSAQNLISSGEISIELVANKFILFTKGYLSLYNEFS